MQTNSSPAPSIDLNAFCPGYCQLKESAGRPKGGGAILDREERAKVNHAVDVFGAIIGHVRCSACRRYVRRRFFRAIAALQRDFYARQHNLL